ncbi:unnamed protein product [Moneuplotes crassus]|uniref:Copine C-terminal domain-containing protein n=1 Tax=Euplotes crassus TaxID=5936 RepID=A0AAD1YAY3_EUPCR|nr:unnamed protein product [Moneuplotes crassus]
MGAQCASHTALGDGRSPKISKKILKIPKDKQTKDQIYDENLVQLEVRFMTVLPSYLQSDSKKYKIKYKVFYGSKMEEWEEEAMDVLHTSHGLFQFDYCITQDDQKIYAKISFETDQSNYFKKSIFGDSTEYETDDSPHEQQYYYNLEACYDVHDTLLLKGMFGEAENLKSNIPLQIGDKSGKNFEEKYEHEGSIVRASIVEKSHKPMKIEFDLNGMFHSESHHLMVSVYEILGTSKKLVFNTIPTTRSEPVNGRPGLFYFGKISMNSDIFEGEALGSVHLDFELKRVKYNKKGKESIKVLGHDSTKLRSIRNLEERAKLQLNIQKSKSLRGTLSIWNSSYTPLFSFLDYKLNLDLHVVPIIAVDYSLGNLTFDMDKKCLHTLKKGEENDYISILSQIKKIYQHLCPYVLGYGMGGKTVPKQQNASDLFALSGDMFDPIVERDQLVEKYSEVFSKIQLSLPINYSPVLDLVCRMARHEKIKGNPQKFFSLIYITPGVIDDFDKTISMAKCIGDLPMCVTVIQLKNEQLEETNDIKTLSQTLVPEFEEAEREFVNYLDYSKFKNLEDPTIFEEMLVKDIPINVKRYLAKQNVFAYQPDLNDFGTKASACQKRKDIVKNAMNSQLSYYDKFGHLSPRENCEYEEEKIDPSFRSSIAEASTRSRNDMIERGSSGDGSKGSWYYDKRQFSFINEIKEDYLKLAPEDDPMMREKLEDHINSRLVFDSSKEFMLHLLSSEIEQGN